MAARPKKVSPWMGCGCKAEGISRKGRSAHKSSNTASKQQSTGFKPGKWQTASRMAVTANKGADIAGEPRIFIVQLAFCGRSHRGHRHRRRAIFFFLVYTASRMAVTANEGADIAGEPIIFIFQLAISGRSHEGVDIKSERIIFMSLRAISSRSQRGRRHHSRRANNFYFPACD